MKEGKKEGKIEEGEVVKRKKTRSYNNKYIL